MKENQGKYKTYEPLKSQGFYIRKSNIFIASSRCIDALPIWPQESQTYTCCCVHAKGIIKYVDNQARAKAKHYIQQSVDLEGSKQQKPHVEKSKSRVEQNEIVKYQYLQ